MNRSARFCVAVFCTILTAAAWAQSKPPAVPNADETLSPVVWLVGGTWVADVKDASDGTETHIENKIRWAPNHQAIEFVATFNGKPHYNGFYAYDPAAKSVGFYYTSSEGELTIGTATADSDGKTVHQDFDITHSDGKTGHLRSTLTRDGNDAYWFAVSMQKDGQWAEVLRIHYLRKA